MTEKRARLVKVMLEIASLDRDEYRRLRTAMWEAVAVFHNRKPVKQLREWTARAS